MVIDQLEIVGKVAVAMILSGLIGLERELKDHPAGLRTHMLVGGASTLFVVLGERITRYMSGLLDTSVIEADPVRIIQAVVLGISFLGAGTILQKSGDGRVMGLTTAASILLISGLGVCVAIEQYVVAIGVTILALLVLHTIQLVEKRINR